MPELSGKLHKSIFKMHPATIVALSFVGTIAAGTGLLLLPVATTGKGISFIDALFTSASAVCVTGLAVVDTGTVFTLFGQLVIVALIQIGGLGLMTISVTLFHLMGRAIPFRQRMIMQDVFAHTPRADIFRLVRNIFVFTALAELFGMLLLFLAWLPSMSWNKALYAGFFHSVSAFCNAGFSLFPDNLVSHRGNVTVNFTICGLIVVGGIGFPVLYDLRGYFRKRKGRRPRLLVQTRIVLVTTAALIVAGALVFWILEQRTTLAGASFFTQIQDALFQSITCRTAGFNTVDIGKCADATLAFMILLMFIGASPGSCGGGIKTTTLAVIAIFTASRIRRERRVNVYKKSLPSETVSRGISLLLLSIGVIGVVLFMILLGETLLSSQPGALHNRFLAFLFETVSAFGTVGLSMGITPGLSAWAKSWLVIMMYIGRVGILTLTYILIGNGASRGLEYAEENVMIG
jgi:trk system potassium uptake protein TrkH